MTSSRTNNYYLTAGDATFNRGHTFGDNLPFSLSKEGYTTLRSLSLSHLTANQHLLMAACRDVSLLPPLFYIFVSLKKTWRLIRFHPKLWIYEPQYLTNFLSRVFGPNVSTSPTGSEDDSTPIVSNYTAGTPEDNIGFLVVRTLANPRASEHLFCALWCFVSLYLSYATLDSLMIRWMVKYSTAAAILRMFSLSVLIVTFELLLVNSLSPENSYFLHTWIIISCVLTCGYIWQSYLTSDLNYIRSISNKRRTISPGYVDSLGTAATVHTPAVTNNSERGSADDRGLRIRERGEGDASLFGRFEGSCMASSSAIDIADTTGSVAGLRTSTSAVTSTSFPETSGIQGHQPQPHLSPPPPSLLEGLERRAEAMTDSETGEETPGFSSKKTIDLYNITVFCVVPVGLASFITMIGLLRNLFIQRLDVEQLARSLQESVG